MTSLDHLAGKAIPVVRFDAASDARIAVDWLREGGLTIFEITATVPNFTALIAELAARPDLLIGAGTLLDAETAAAAIEAGAKFLVSPCFVAEVAEAGARAALPVFPGAATPTEVLNAHRAGAAAVKVFPAKQLGGPGYISALRSVFPHIPLMPTGGITLDDAGDYLRAGAVALGMGGQLVTVADIRAGRRDEVVARAARLAGLKA
ncbi:MULTISPECIES: bifunctional 4-hydroxy-2-oxoglutarate aldolase/2-dehydro-3-deoxy-phosphogluconate aldolase [Rhodomicrobium]|uniref:bifunctional 4-hydroxy-2-oxoglutarate aldolase/2-dehydro-3-deoxy-phosphogluconate aldolase n=1 Tax=Rhodomicrobium TaxID=1068 RepID=UPI000B4B0A00|nr:MULTISPECIES: bifunctional 4-hydroxy-2-oxoglutarate aldolase/2-dehydro-3-deoxy-phosphogluconate aldolase [Rhodomicrobium]